MAEIPGSLETQTREPLDGKYWVQSFSDINTGLTFQGLLRFDKTTEKLWIKKNSGWVEITAGSSTSNVIQIGEVTAGTTPSVTATTTGSNTVLDFVLPRGERGIAATIGIERIEVSPDGLGHIYNIGNENNAQFVIQLPEGPVGPKGDKFTIDTVGTQLQLNQATAVAEIGTVFLIDDPFSAFDGKLFIKGETLWLGPFPFKGPKGKGIYVAYANTYDGLGRSFTLDSSKKFISYINSDTDPSLSAFTNWVPISVEVESQGPTQNYQLPEATATILGGIKLGNGLTSVGGVVSSQTLPHTHPASQITGLSTVATSGNYNDLLNKPISGKTKVVDILEYGSTQQDIYHTYLEVSKLILIAKSPGISSISYSKNGGTTFTPIIAGIVNMDIAVNEEIAWRITYEPTYTRGTLQLTLELD